MGEESKPPFWTTLPGLITAVAALVTAVGGILAVYSSRQQKPPDAIRRSNENPSRPSKRENNPATDAARVGQQNSIREGLYELYRVNGAPQKKGILMRIRRVSDDLFLVDTRTPVGYAGDTLPTHAWNGELRRKGNDWELVVLSRREGVRVPGQGSTVSRQGPLLSIASQTDTLVWEEQ